MFATPISGINNWNQDYRTIGWGNYGYGMYTQDVNVFHSPFSGVPHIEQDIDFIPLRNSGFGPYASFPAIYHQRHVI